MVQYYYLLLWGFPGGIEVKAPASNARDLGSIPGSGISPGEGNGNQLQYSCLENPMDGEAWQATVHGVAKSRTRLSDFTSLHFTSLLCKKCFFLQVKSQVLHTESVPRFAPVHCSCLYVVQTSLFHDILQECLCWNLQSPSLSLCSRTEMVGQQRR